MTQFKNLTRAQKGRILSFIAITLLLLFFILIFSLNARALTDQIPYTDSCNIDGSDFSPIANVCVAGFNSVINLLNMIIYVGITWITSTICMIAWRFIAIQKTSVVAELEWKIAQYTWLVFIAVSLIGCLCFLQLSHLTFCTFLTSLPILLLWLLGVLPLQKKIWKQKDTNDET